MADKKQNPSGLQRFGSLIHSGFLSADRFANQVTFTHNHGELFFKTNMGAALSILLYISLFAYGVRQVNKIYGFADTIIFESTSLSQFTYHDRFGTQDGLQFAWGIMAYDSNQENIEDPDIGVMHAFTYGWRTGGLFFNEVKTRPCTSSDFNFEDNFTTPSKNYKFYSTNPDQKNDVEFYKKKYNCLD